MRKDVKFDLMTSTRDETVRTGSGFWGSYARFLENNIIAAVVGIDRFGRIIIFNNRAEEEFGMDASLVLGRKFKKVFPKVPTHELYILQSLERAIDYNGVEYSYCPYTRREGTFVHYVTRMHNDEGGVFGCVWIRRDLTLARRFHKEVNDTEVQAIVSQIAAATAHEIRNPLAAARGYIQLAQQNKGCPPHLYDYLTISLEEIDIATRIISDFLALVHPKAEGLQITDINSLINDVVHLVSNVAVMTDISLSTELKNNIPACTVDSNQIRQALLNVLRNAIQAMPQGGKLIVSSEFAEDDEEVCIAVVDTGIGIPTENLARVFQPFFSTKVEGSGLGLTLTNRIIQHHNGRIELDSKTGTGTRVRIYFPVNGT